MKISSFQFREGALEAIVECSATDALRVLAALQALDVNAATQSPPPAVSPPAVAPIPAPAPIAAPVPVSAPAPSLQPKVDEQAIARIAASNPKPEPKPEKSKAERKPKAEPEVAAPAVEVPQADPPKATAIEPTPSPVTKTESPTPGDLPEEIRKAVRIRDVLSHFVRQGARTFEEAWPKLREVQSQIPALANNSSLEERARRAWEVMDLADL